MRALRAVAFTLVVAVAAFVLGARWGPEIVSRLPVEVSEDQSWLCSAPPGKFFQIGKTPDRAQLHMRVRTNARSVPVARETFLTALNNAQWRLFIRIAEDSSLPSKGGDMVAFMMPPGAVSQFIRGMKCERLAEQTAQPDIDLRMIGSTEGYETTIIIDGEESHWKNSWES